MIALFKFYKAIYTLYITQYTVMEAYNDVHNFSGQ